MEPWFLSRERLVFLGVGFWVGDVGGTIPMTSATVLLSRPSGFSGCQDRNELWTAQVRRELNGRIRGMNRRRNRTQAG